VIVAAGASSRLDPLTLNRPKPLLEINGRSIIERSIFNLKQVGVKDIAVVTGYLKNQFEEALKEEELTFIENPRYDVTNNMASLGYAKDFIGGEDFIYLHGDLVYDAGILDACFKYKGDITLVVDKKECDEEDMKVKVSGGILVESNKDIPLSEAYGEWIGITKFTSKGGQLMFEEIERVLAEGGLKYYDTYAMTNLAKRGHKIDICTIQGSLWVEVDFKKELEKAKEICTLLDKRGGK